VCVEVSVEWAGEDLHEKVFHRRLDSVGLQVAIKWAGAFSKISLSFVPSSDFKRLKQQQAERIGRTGATEGASTRLTRWNEAYSNRQEGGIDEVDMYVSGVRI